MLVLLLSVLLPLLLLLLLLLVLSLIVACSFSCSEGRISTLMAPVLRSQQNTSLFERVSVISTGVVLGISSRSFSLCIFFL